MFNIAHFEVRKEIKVMAKINISVDIDWLGEDGTLDGALKDEIVNAVVSRIAADSLKGIGQKVDNMVEARVKEAVGVKLNEVLEDFLNKPRTITDRWGDVQKENVTVIGLLKKSCEDFIEGYVDKDGEPTSYSSYDHNKKRIDYIIEKNISSTLDFSIKKAAEEIKNKLKEYIDTTLKTQIGENVAQVIGLNSITAKMVK
jgi:DNA-directed RNA polymerase subunit L